MIIFGNYNKKVKITNIYTIYINVYAYMHFSTGFKS